MIRLAATVWLLALVACVDNAFIHEFQDVELRVLGLDENASRLRIEVNGDWGLSSTLEGRIDATFGSVVHLPIRVGWTVSVEGTVFDYAGTVLQKGQIASAIRPTNGSALWQMTLVPAGREAVVCDDLDNDGNGEVDEDECAE